jgi:Tfp pilus assembly protein PilE
MKIKQSGFTLIKLMIVVAIAILTSVMIYASSVMIHAYSDYMTKLRVSEARMLFSGIKTCVDTFFQEEVRMPYLIHPYDGSTEYQNICTPQTTSKYTSNIVYSDSVPITITATLKGWESGIFGENSKGIIQWMIEDNEWVCTNPPTATDVAKNYLPKACR